ncbi:MAG: hypothetical protein KGL39_46680 [Patescibacteria group bacterium]|nr:hypothetical protein [Patescibacteria group bacterium]
MSAADRQRLYRQRLKRRGLIRITIELPKVKLAELRRLIADWKRRLMEHRL